MKQDDICKALINSTVRVVARDDLDKATTKILSAEAGVNEVNIYRMFKSKEELFKKTFIALDSELISTILRCLPVMDMAGLPFEERCRRVFFYIWGFLLKNGDKSVYFIRYYYSPYFRKYSSEEHKAAYRVVVKKITPVFREGTDVWMMLNHIMDFMFSYAVKVLHGEMRNTEETAMLVYRIIYSAMESQLATDGVSTGKSANIDGYGEVI